MHLDSELFLKRREIIIIQCTHEGHTAKVKVELLEHQTLLCQINITR